MSLMPLEVFLGLQRAAHTPLNELLVRMHLSCLLQDLRSSKGNSHVMVMKGTCLGGSLYLPLPNQFP